MYAHGPIDSHKTLQLRCALAPPAGARCSSFAGTEKNPWHISQRFFQLLELQSFRADKYVYICKYTTHTDIYVCTYVYVYIYICRDLYRCSHVGPCSVPAWPVWCSPAREDASEDDLVENPRKPGRAIGPPSTHYLRSWVSKAIPIMVFGTGGHEYSVLGPSAQSEGLFEVLIARPGFPQSSLIEAVFKTALGTKGFDRSAWESTLLYTTRLTSSSILKSHFGPS